MKDGEGNGYVNTIHQPVTVSSNMHMQSNTHTNEAFFSASSYKI